MGLAEEMLKATRLRATVIKINVAFLVFFLIAYMVLVLQPKSFFFDKNAASIVRCTFGDCHMRKVAAGVIANKIVTERILTKNRANKASLFKELHGKARLGLVNLRHDEVVGLGIEGEATRVEFERVSEIFEWKDLFPEWIDEEEESEGASCPELPMPDFSAYEQMDVVVAKLPCNRSVTGWNRDVFRLQVHLVAANLAVQNGRRDRHGKVRVALLSQCEPMMELFRCDDMAGREGAWWMYQVEVERLEEKLRLPLGSCNLALPLWAEGVNNEYNLSHLAAPSPSPRSLRPRREAYATVIHSSETYLCGAITLAQSIRQSGSTKDLILLHDHSISRPALATLAAAGWKLRKVKRIRNPRAARGTYNEYNYSKFRLWQLTDYDKVIFVDADIIILRSLDVLFRFPQMTAVGNDASLFNSGIMVIEPSNCTFDFLIRNRRAIVSYNGGDQGFLNEVFVWWHRLPRRVNYLKNFWANTTGERSLKSHLFDAEPPEVYAIHYLGLKPWNCYREYDCNWDIAEQRVYASDTAHRRWWRVHDAMDEKLRAPCKLTAKRKEELEWDRHVAKKSGFEDQHWKINITDRRKYE